MIEVIRSKQAWLGLRLNGFAAKGSSLVVGLPETNTVRLLNFDRHLDSYNNTASSLVHSNLKYAQIQQNSTHTILFVVLQERKTLSTITNTDRRRHPNTMIVFGGIDNKFGMHELIVSHTLEISVIGFLEKDQAALFTPSSSSASRILEDQARQNEDDSPDDEEPLVEDHPHKNIWLAHACLMTLGWGLLVPVAIGSSVIRNLFSDGVWLQIHRMFNSMALFLTIVGFALAFYAVRDTEESTTNARGEVDIIVENTHRFVGVIVVLLGIIQALTGYVRPQAAEELTHIVEAENHPNIEVEDHHQQAAATTTTRESQLNIVENKSTRRKVWELQHRLLGMGLIGCSWYNIHRGISIFEDRFGNLLEDDERSMTEIFWGAVIGLVVSFLVLATIARVFA